MAPVGRKRFKGKSDDDGDGEMEEVQTTNNQAVVDYAELDTEPWDTLNPTPVSRTIANTSTSTGVSPVVDENANNRHKKARGSKKARLSEKRVSEGEQAETTNLALSRSSRKRRRTNEVDMEQNESVVLSSDDSEDEFVIPEPPTKKAHKRRHRRPSDTMSTISNRSKPRMASLLKKQMRDKDKFSSQQNENGIVEPYSGVVKSLKMYNFMCHSGFYQEWHPNLNFVTGENGSGKSALLTGLLIGLGAKATVTSRTRSMSSLIQKGKESARTEITLVNNGALSKAKYGSEITIERTISRSGTSNYRLRVFGKFRKMKKHELDFILLSFNIQLDNPVAILNQEVAKNFLRTKDPKDKYQLFYQGTLLSKLFQLLNESRADIITCHENLEYYKARILEMQTKVDQLKNKLREYDNLKTMKKKLADLQEEYLWAVANDEEKRLTELNNKIRSHDLGITKFAEQLKEAKIKKQEVEQKLEPGIEKIEEIRTTIKEKEKVMEATRNQIKELQKTIVSCRATVKTNKDMIKRKDKTLSDLRATLEQLMATSAADKERIVREYEECKEQLGAEKNQALSELDSLKQDVEQFDHAMEAASTETTNVIDEFNHLKKSLDAKQRDIKRMQTPGTNKFAIYGRNMETLVSKITANARRFKKLPRGPVGAYITIKDATYAGLVEYILQKPFLTTFIVESNDDFLLLKQLIQECYRDRQSIGSSLPSIKINNFSDTVYDLSNTKALVPGVPTLLDLVEIENNDPVITNGLIDYVQAESTLVFKTNQDAAEILKDPRRCPRTVKMAVTLDFYRFTPAPNYTATNFAAKGHRAMILKTSKQSLIENLKNECAKLQDRFNELKPQVEQKQQEEIKLRRQHNSMKAELETKRRAVGQIERNLRENELRKYKEPDVESHVEEIQDIEQQLEVLTKENEAKEKCIETKTKEADNLGKQREELQFEIKKLNKSIESNESEKQKLQQKSKTLDLMIERLNTKMKEFDRAKQPTLENLTRCEKEYQRKLKQAEDKCPRIETARSSDDVKGDVDDAREKVEAIMEHVGNVQVLRVDCKKQKEELDAKMNEFRPIYRSYCMLKTLVQSQFKFLITKRHQITNGLSVMFRGLVQERGYKGEMMIDHAKQELHFFVCPDKSASKRAKNAIVDNNKITKKSLVEYSLGLSGGERSFSTICFILSLWQVMECPFYMLDEFDVFMDAFNRKVSQQALMTHAKSFLRNQFFLFSPLDLVEIPSQNEATVIRLKPARPDNSDDTVQGNSFSGDNEMENVDPSSGREKIAPVAKAAAAAILGKRGRPKTASSVAMGEKNKSIRH